jgi:creatinine amidohydrolase/Fe(II)-dependent formamide hydrolase-like protein
VTAGERGRFESHPLPRERYLPFLTTEEVAALPKERAAVTVVISAIEQHGPHMPLVTDLLEGEMLLGRALERVPERVQLWALPSLAYGKSNEHTAFPGTVTLSTSTLSAVVMDIARSVARAGFRRLILVNSHGGNRTLLEALARDVRVETGLMVFPLSTWLIGLEFEPVSEDEARWGTHAGDWETSMMLALAPELVHMDRMPAGPAYPSHEGEEPRHITPFGPVGFAWTTEELSAAGAIGDPAQADAERGEAIVERITTRLAEILAEMASFEMPRPAGSP